jgi:hypothetical protein
VYSRHARRIAVALAEDVSGVDEVRSELMLAQNETPVMRTDRPRNKVSMHS